MIKVGTLAAVAALATILSAGFAVEASAAGKKAKAKAKYKSCGTYMYVDKKTRKCTDARLKK